MIHLKENETYKIETLDDLFNCPVNMMGECLKVIQETLLKRLNMIEETGKGIDCSNITIDLVNDGIHESSIITDRTKRGL